MISFNAKSFVLSEFKDLKSLFQYCMEQLATVKAFFKAGRSAKDAFELLHAGYGEQAISKQMV